VVPKPRWAASPVPAKSDAADKKESPERTRPLRVERKKGSAPIHTKLPLPKMTNHSPLLRQRMPSKRPQFHESRAAIVAVWH
jgi:hypothetical protein